MLDYILSLRYLVHVGLFAFMWVLIPPCQSDGNIKIIKHLQDFNYVLGILLIYSPANRHCVLVKYCVGFNYYVMI